MKNTGTPRKDVDEQFALDDIDRSVLEESVAKRGIRVRKAHPSLYFFIQLRHYLLSSQQKNKHTQAKKHQEVHRLLDEMEEGGTISWKKFKAVLKQRKGNYLFIYVFL